MTELRARLPKWNVPSAAKGSAKTELDVQEPAMRGSHTPFENHWLRPPDDVDGADQVGPHGVDDAGVAQVGDDVDRVARSGPG